MDRPSQPDPTQLLMSAAGRMFEMPDGRTITGPMAASRRPPPGMGRVIERPGFCALWGMSPLRPILLLEIGTSVYWWWEGELPRIIPPGQTRFDW